MKAFRRLFIWSPEFCLSAAQFCAVCAMLIGVRMFAAACMEEATISRILCFVEDVADLSEVRKRTCGGHNLYHLLYVEGDEGRTFFVCDRYERIHVPLLLWEKGGLSEEVGNCERIQRPTELPLEPVPTQLSCYGKRRVCYG